MADGVDHIDIYADVEEEFTQVAGNYRLIIYGRPWIYVRASAGVVFARGGTLSAALHGKAQRSPGAAGCSVRGDRIRNTL